MWKNWNLKIFEFRYLKPLSNRDRGFFIGLTKLIGFSSRIVTPVLTGVVRVHVCPQHHTTDKAKANDWETGRVGVGMLTFVLPIETKTGLMGSEWLTSGNMVGVWLDEDLVLKTSNR
jgi:hypothetical protein